ncbi:MAG: hypothetical protein MRJ65_06185 [Candidatus Brocadiaceae bacterium]|nr:hypothetical protein [Candidatus Brocadiaceae bacterium]
MMNLKNIVLKHGEKFIIGLIVCGLVYVTVYTYFLLNSKVQKIRDGFESYRRVVDNKLKTSKPMGIVTPLNHSVRLNDRFTSPPKARILPKPHIFWKLVNDEAISGVEAKDLLKKSDRENLPGLKVSVPGDTEFVYKGGTADLALIQVRKHYGEKWWEESFAVKKGEAIGRKVKTGKQTIDYDTRCKLVNIIPDTQKSLVLKKSQVLQDENGKFLGTSITDEIFKVTASSIVFTNDVGESYKLWVGERVNLGTQTVAVRKTTNATPIY